MRRRSAEPGRLAPLDGGSSRRTTVMRLCPGQPAYISLIRRRRRLILRCAPSPSETLLTSGDPIRQRIHLTVGPSISANETTRAGCLVWSASSTSQPGKSYACSFGKTPVSADASAQENRPVPHRFRLAPLAHPMHPCSVRRCIDMERALGSLWKLTTFVGLSI